ncbi:RHS repeat-associated core domain-containing protein [Neolewinella sp.]|uniref:RHS repeat-associated core domain-containing protein n=1 Tax=Neolewinella sp. TaxID=2993543 RepID=UPI003B52C74A
MLCYRYNGKELNTDLGLYDYGARWYDPATARFLTVDPVTGKMPGWSPYNYVMGNPIKLVDPTGMWPENPIKDAINEAKNYAINKVRDYVVNTAKSIGSAVRNSLTDVTVEPQAKMELSFGAQVGGEIDKSAGMVVNLGSAKLFTTKMGVELSSVVYPKIRTGK